MLILASLTTGMIYYQAVKLRYLSTTETLCERILTLLYNMFYNVVCYCSVISSVLYSGG